MDGGRGSFQSHSVFATRLRQLVFAQNVRLPNQVNDSVVHPPTPPMEPPPAPPAATGSSRWSWLGPVIGAVMATIALGAVAAGGLGPWRGSRVPVTKTTSTEIDLPLLTLPVGSATGDER